VTDEVNYDRLDNALIHASAGIGSYVSTRFPVPVNPTPLILKIITIDLALHSAARSRRQDVRGARAASRQLAQTPRDDRSRPGLGVREDQAPDDPAPAEGTGIQTGLVVRSVRV
jgi:phage gp36-like protein